MRIRTYQTNGRGFLRAEIEWDAGATQRGNDTKRFTLPTGEEASLAVTQDKATHIVLVVYPDDVADPDRFQLPIVLGQPLPGKLCGATLPSLYYGLPYIITPLDDTTCGFGFSVGIK